MRKGSRAERTCWAQAAPLESGRAGSPANPVCGRPAALGTAADVRVGNRGRRGAGGGRGGSDRSARGRRRREVPVTTARSSPVVGVALLAACETSCAERLCPGLDGAARMWMPLLASGSSTRPTRIGCSLVVSVKAGSLKPGVGGARARRSREGSPDSDHDYLPRRVMGTSRRRCRSCQGSADTPTAGRLSTGVMTRGHTQRRGASAPARLWGGEGTVAIGVLHSTRRLDV